MGDRNKTGNNYRTETDSMGEVRVPIRALYGPQTQRAVENFTIYDQPLPWVFIQALLLIKQSAAIANNELGVLSSLQSKAIVECAVELRVCRPEGQFPVSVFQTGSGTSSNMNVNEVISGLAMTKGIKLSANDHVNLSQSSNDVIPTALHVATAVETKKKLLPALKTLRGELLTFADKHRDVIKTGRTHLMDALPVRLKAEVDCWAAQIKECCERHESALVRLCRLPLGGTAVGSGVNCPPGFSDKTIGLINEETGMFFSLAPSLYKGISSLDTIVEYSGILKTTAIALSKIANDLRWMNSGPLTGLAEINLPALQPGSSIMPAKINPVIPEAVLMAAAQVIGNDTTINIAGLGGNFQLNTMLPLAASNILQSLELLSGSAISLADKVIPKITVNHKNLRRSLSMNPILVTALTPITGYMKAAEIGKIAAREKRSVIEVAKELTDISSDKLAQLLDPKNLADWTSS
ncbi:MAG: class II fumarate hydratase [Deltaproteobacteria bacterium]|nr:class II fumarate hydratase [Deltaproteobacteria bacterium]